MNRKIKKGKDDPARQVLQLLQRFESRNITYVDPDGSWPVVWERARGVHVWDVAGKRYLDLTAAFGVAAAGHGNARAVRAAQRQMGRLLHAMGDVHPHRPKAELARELSRITFERWTARKPKLAGAHEPATGKTIFCNSGFEAVEAALKTARLATGKPSIIAFEGAYHGLGYGALNATHREHFRAPFKNQLRQFATFAPFPTRTENLRGLQRQLEGNIKAGDFGAVLVEPIQVRGGINIPPIDFLPMLRRLCDQYSLLLVLDEIYTGFGRTGRWFGCEHSATVPDLICLGKALTGGFPLSACVGRADLMDRAWPPSTGEAIHTSTFLGHPVGCAMALAQIREIESKGLVRRSAESGDFLLHLLRKEFGQEADAFDVRGLGLLGALELRTPRGEPDSATALAVINDMLRRGYILLPEGAQSNIISLTPPLTITQAQLRQTVTQLKRSLASVAGTSREDRK